MGHEDHGLIDYLGSSPTSGHAVERASAILEEAGFEYLDESALWDGPLPGSFHTTRNTGSLIAVRRGRLAAGESGFRIACAHTDFPGLRLKPDPVRSIHGHSMLSTEIYGSPILSTWFDRDLSLAGTAIVRCDGGVLGTRLFAVPGVVGRISMPALHLNRNMNDEGFTFNKEDHLLVLASLNGFSRADLESTIAEACSCGKDDLAGWTAHLVDAQPPATGGPGREFIFAGGLDDLAMCHAALCAITAAPASDHTSVACLFDNEEVGSGTSSGALSRFVDVVLENLAEDRRDLNRALRSSIIVSIDGAHGLHPCYESKYERNSRPVMNGGPVIKVNAQERYATSALSAAYFSECTGRAGSPVQVFSCRNDIPCGGTIGPMLSTRLGIQAVDAGNPILSMHSIRECTGTADHGFMIGTLVEHFRGSVAFDQSRRA